MSRAASRLSISSMIAHRGEAGCSSDFRKAIALMVFDWPCVVHAGKMSWVGKWRAIRWVGRKVGWCGSRSIATPPQTRRFTSAWSCLLPRTHTCKPINPVKNHCDTRTSLRIRLARSYPRSSSGIIPKEIQEIHVPGPVTV